MSAARTPGAGEPNIATGTSAVDPSREFATARQLEREGRYDDAFRAFERANALKRSTLDADAHAAQYALLVENVEWLFGPEVFARHRGGDRSRAPIFIVGLPRSGSTLIEQILDTHSLVQGMGELNSFRNLAKQRYPFPGPPPGRRHFPDLAADYLADVRSQGWRGAPHFTDKQLNNIWFIGSIHLAFPRATIIHCVRDPLDTCLSCFRSDFAEAEPIYYGLADIGAHYARYRRIVNHWEKVLPGRVIAVDHEALVADFPNQARRLVEACGLRWEEGCLRFYENPRTVLTSSRDQVRRPIFHDSVGRWRHYEPHLGPLLRALGPHAAKPSSKALA
jgi:hypothetical protein